jgi:hypothetical protein
MFSRTLVLTSSAAALLLVGLASSPVVTTVDAQGRGGSRIRFQEMDDNRDGIITREEWNGSDRSFEVHDWNGDGQLSGPEVRPGARRTVTAEPDHVPGRNERYVNWTRGGFTALDHNRDNRISPNEWHFDGQTFRRVDANRDNSISLSEFLGEADGDDDREDSFDDLDYNNNGRVERSEWHGSLAEFRRLDANQDGILSRYEVVGAQESFNTYNEFAGLDYNRNGSLERAEWHWSNVSFTSRDTNRDGVISQEEFNAAGGSPDTASTQSAAGTQTVRVNSQQRWTDTNLTVRAGDVITFSTQGQIQMSDNPQDVAGPAGATSRRMAKDSPVLNVIAGALIGQIGGYPPFAIGDQRSIVAPVSGRLYLGVNDDHLPDNRGEFVTTVGVQRR